MRKLKGNNNQITALYFILFIPQLINSIILFQSWRVQFQNGQRNYEIY